jgi:hypothetical protein
MMGVLGAPCGATQLVEMTASLVAYLSTLTETLDDPDADIEDSLRRLATEIKVAVQSFLGLTVMTTDGLSRQISLTMLEPATRYGDVLTSLHLAAPAQMCDGVLVSLVELTLYAHNPGAFVDLAADLGWLTGRNATEFLLDQHPAPADTPNMLSGLDAASLIDRAMGVLIAGGYTPESASCELDARAAHLHVDRRSIAAKIIDAVAGA